MRSNAEPPETTVRAEEETEAAQAACTEWANKTCDGITGSDCI